MWDGSTPASIDVLGLIIRRVFSNDYCFLIDALILLYKCSLTNDDGAKVFTHKNIIQCFKLWQFLPLSFHGIINVRGTRTDIFIEVNDLVYRMMDPSQTDFNPKRLIALRDQKTSNYSNAMLVRKGDDAPGLGKCSEKPHIDTNDIHFHKNVFLNQ